MGTQPAPRTWSMDRLTDSCKAPADGDRGLLDLRSLHKASDQQHSRCREPRETEAKSADISFLRLPVNPEERNSGKHGAFRLTAECRWLRSRSRGGVEGAVEGACLLQEEDRQLVLHGGGVFWLGWEECSLVLRRAKAVGRFQRCSESARGLLI